MKKSLLGVVLVGAVALVGCIPQPGVSTTFHVEITSTATFGPADASGNIRATFLGTAQGTFFDHATARGSFVGSPTVEPCPSTSAGEAHIVTLTATNGDALRMTWSGSQCQPAAGSLHSTEVYSINGGTGRFEGATGNGTVISDFTVGANESVHVVDGSITFAK